MTTIKVQYRRSHFRVEAARPKACQCCGKVRQIQLHHWQYAYRTSEVRKDKQLALRNTSWLCFRCHMKADALRVAFDVPAAEAEILMKLMGGKASC